MVGYMWGRGGKGRGSAWSKDYPRSRRAPLKEVSGVSVADLLAAREDVAVVEKVGEQGRSRAKQL